MTDSLTLPRGGKLPIHQISPTLWVLSAGRPTADPMSTLVSASMKQLLNDAKDEFDWMIVDTPPIATLPCCPGRGVPRMCPTARRKV